MIEEFKTRRRLLGVIAATMLSCALIPASAQTTTDSTAKPKPHKTTAKRSLHKKKSTRTRGQQKIDSDRARSIQEALIREHYLTGEATGTWNQSCEDAMRRYQADHGWQAKTVPDSRALISLGLGPSKDHLLNPESAMTTSPVPTTSHGAPTTANPAPPQSQPTDPPSPQ